MKNRSFPLSILVVLGLLTLKCGRPVDVDEAPAGPVGVGLDPADIRPASETYGGIIEYSLLDFRGSDLSIGLFGFVDYEVTGQWVLGLGLLTYPPSTDWGAFSVGVSPAPPEPDSCYIQTYGGSLTISGDEVDVGESILIEGVVEDAKFEITRNIQDYGFDFGELNYVYYLSLGIVDEGAASMVSPRFVPESLMKLSFPGAIPPDNADFSYIPRPLSSVGDVYFIAPSSLEGLKIDGSSLGERGYEYPEGGDISFTWDPTPIENQHLTIAIRYLPEDRGEETDAAYREGCREPDYCGEEREYDPSTGRCYKEGGIMERNLVELVCHARDDGEFTIRSDMIEEMEAEASTLTEDVGGAVLFVATTVMIDSIEVPPVLHGGGKRGEISPVRLISNNVIITRFYR